jgi:hypothetical protein
MIRDWKAWKIRETDCEKNSNTFGFDSKVIKFCVQIMNSCNTNTQ